MLINEERKTLFTAYCEELNQITGKEIWPEEDREAAFLDYINEPFEWFDIAAKNGRLIGFVVMAKAPNCHPDADRFIVQTYITPKYRKQGYMRAFWHSYIEKTHHRFCMLILRQNASAKAFWKHLFDSEDYTALNLSEGYAHIDTAIEAQYGYGPKE